MNHEFSDSTTFVLGCSEQIVCIYHGELLDPFLRLCCLHRSIENRYYMLPEREEFYDHKEFAKISCSSILRIAVHLWAWVPTPTMIFIFGKVYIRQNYNSKNKSRVTRLVSVGNVSFRGFAPRSHGLKSIPTMPLSLGPGPPVPWRSHKQAYLT